MAPRAGFSTNQIRDKARKDLLFLLEAVRGKKNLILERSLAGPIGTIVTVSTLQEYGVDKFFFLENNNADTSQRNVVFIARGECARHAQTIADQVRRLQRESQTGHEFHIFWVPRRTTVSDKLLEEAGVLGDVNISELPLYFFPLEKDVLSLELDDSFRDLYLAKDVTPSFLLAKGLMGIQQNHGLFPRIIGKGDNAKRVAELLARMRQEILAGEDASGTSRAGLTPSTLTESVIIIDREVDFVTPLLTQLTYEGLVDEVFGIQNNQTEVDTTVVGAPSQASTTSAQSRKQKIQLDSSDKLYDQLRDTNFAIVGSLLNKVARRLQNVQKDYEGRNSQKSIADLKDFVSKLPGYQAEQRSLRVHTGLAEEIMKYTRTDQFKGLLEAQQNLAAGADPSTQFEAIEELIARDTPLPEVLRLLCIYSCISGGIKPKEFDQFRRLILEGYGHQHILTLQNLEKLQLFLSRSSPLAEMIPMSGASGNSTGTKTNYTYLRKLLRLIVDEVQEDDPNDIAYVYSGYAPLSVRLVQCVLQKQYLLQVTRGNGASGAAGASAAQGWHGFDEAVKHVRGQTFYELQKGEEKAVKARALLSGGTEKQTVFVVFVGGITFTEIAALRFIAKKEEARRNIVICTTSIISGDRMMKAAIEEESYARDNVRPTTRVVVSLSPLSRNDYTEIVVWTEDMDLDPSQDEADPPTATPASDDLPMAEGAPSDAHGVQPADESPLTNLSDMELSELSSVPSSESSKATTPVDLDGQNEFSIPSTFTPPIREAVRRTFDVKPKSSIPTGLSSREYAAQCFDAAQASRLNPYVLHQEEYRILRQHISHTQVTTYLNIRNGILRLWHSNPRVAVTRNEAVGCANTRWFDVASVCFDWLVRRGYINFGCVEFPMSNPKGEPEAKFEGVGRRKKVVVIGAGMSGLGCARHLDGLIRQYSDHFIALGEEPPEIVIVEGRSRIGGRLYSKEFQSKPKTPVPGFEGQRFTAEMGGMIITGFGGGNPMNVIVRGQLCLPYRALTAHATIYDSNGKAVDYERDNLVEELYNYGLERVSEFKYKPPSTKLIQGNKDLMDEGRDAVSDGPRTIQKAEEDAAAAFPNAPPVSQQNVPEPVNLVPVSLDKLTGRVHTQPGETALATAAEKLKEKKWTLKAGVDDNADIDLVASTQKQGATLGSVLDEAFGQFRGIVDLTALDQRLINWHVANLEYSNATNLHNLSLQGWDIDAGNEWLGNHTMVVGGYQSVPRGLLNCPTPLDIRTKAPVEKITYNAESNGVASIQCEDGTVIEADCIISTIPLGVLKQGSIMFDPPLPSWKTDAISRIGYGVLNKLVLVYDEPFWDDKRHIFGVLRDALNRNSTNQSDYSSMRGRMFQWFNVTQTTGLPCLVALMAGDAGFDTEHNKNDDLIAEATKVLRSVFGSKVPYPTEAVVTRWAADKFARGSYSSAGPDMLPDDYDTMSRPIGNLFFAGEHTIGTHPATVHGAYMSGLRAASEVLEFMIGPIEIPTPLVLPRGGQLNNKRKEMETPKDPEEARRDAYDVGAWQHILIKIGDRPSEPPKAAATAFVLYSRAKFEIARQKCEEGRSGRKKTGSNEVRAMISKMWKAAGPEEKKPHEDEAAMQKAAYVEAVQNFSEKLAKWDKDYAEVLAAYQKDHPYVPLNAVSDGRRASREVTKAH
ncbi:Vacuolar protein sorting-associated protein 33A [Colletotrichum orbiculare MAFF 240422]|uniref:Vacuolar protein sorting-associated protein 33A n=1 Tax=Colletotrichum orbiculare (strain 104-T / ATCC 96160 / CBS 514.97 / LARS 414 / MAFF 240422) TaxID=1213857 RepID=A0A484GAH1_COLOR|nr:Vacuolar protein sorting-associated protein 33A [Colletotrichum orbiculare MAFF 240422]